MLTSNIVAQTLYNVKRAAGVVHATARTEALAQAETMVGIAPDPNSIAA